MSTRPGPQPQACRRGGWGSHWRGSHGFVSPEQAVQKCRLLPSKSASTWAFVLPVPATVTEHMASWGSQKYLPLSLCQALTWALGSFHFLDDPSPVSGWHLPLSSSAGLRDMMG